jgi:hypothetical protein
MHVWKKEITNENNVDNPRVSTNEEYHGKLVGVMRTNELNPSMQIFQSLESQPNHPVDY